MKKIFSLFAAVLFAGSMMAADAAAVLDFTQAAWGFPTDYVKNATNYTNGGYTITVAAASNGFKALMDGDKVKALLYGKKDATITLPAMTFNVAKIKVYGVAGASGKVTFNVFVGEDAVSTEAKSSITDHEFEIASASQAAGTVYTLKVTNANNAQVSKIEFYEAVAGAPANPTFSVAGGSFIAAQTVELACETEGAKIYYTLDGTDPTNASAEYATALNIATTTTVKAIAIKNAVASDIVSATYTIVNTTGDGSKEKPFTVADLYALNNGMSGKYWVVGYIVGCAANEGEKAAETSVSNIALGDAADQESSLVPVQLVKDTEIRTALNVVDNAGNIGKKVKVYGSLESYFLAPGVKNPEAYEFDTTTSIDNTAVEGKAVKSLKNGQLVIEKNGVKFNVMGQTIR